MVKNLNQLKKTLKKGTCFEITAHCRPEYVGQKRKVTVANTQGFYSIVPDEPDCKVTLANSPCGREPGPWPLHYGTGRAGEMPLLWGACPHPRKPFRGEWERKSHKDPVLR